MKKYLLEFVVFITGGSLMIIELCGSRILAPYMGASLSVWTSLIGIILGSLSVGYYFGGKLADIRGSKRMLSLIVSLCSALTIIILIIRTPLLTSIDALQINLGLKATIAALCLFALPSTAFGMVTPIATRLRMQSLKTAGNVMGNLYAASTIGSIAGTFLAGFVLLAYFSITQILISISVVLLLTSLLIDASSLFKKLFPLLILVGCAMVIPVSKDGVKVYESRYNHIEIYTQQGIKVLQLDNRWNSGILENGELGFSYVKYYFLAKKINSQASKMLMIGGGAFTVPNSLIKKSKDLSIDVVEIDPKLEKIAYDEFQLKKSPRLTIFNEDGRTFLNRQSKLKNKQYDAILMDAFSSFSIPFHLTTLESILKMKSLLSKDGVVIVNLISAVKGEGANFLIAQAQTYKKVFANVVAIRVHPEYDEIYAQNIILIASNRNLSNIPYSSFGFNEPFQLDKKVLPILTDDYAPVDQYLRKIEM